MTCHAFLISASVIKLFFQQSRHCTHASRAGTQFSHFSCNFFSIPICYNDISIFVCIHECGPRGAIRYSTWSSQLVADVRGTWSILSAQCTCIRYGNRHRRPCLSGGNWKQRIVMDGLDILSDTELRVVSVCVCGADKCKFCNIYRLWSLNII